MARPMLSYAQNAEDVVLQRVFRDVGEGFYVDVGASVPVDDSVTFHFYQRGWHGVNIEPDPRDYEQLVASRPRDVNLNLAVGRGEGLLAFHPSAVRGQGTVQVELAGVRGDGSVLEVAQMPLARILKEHAPPAGFEFLKVDVEGSEAEVLASTDWRRWRPRVVVVEAVDLAGSPTHETWEPSLLREGYRFGLFDGVNRFYCAEEHEHLLLPVLAAPANVFDNWRPAREIALQDVVQGQLRQEQLAHRQEQLAHKGTQSELAAERAAHAETRGQLAAERSAHAETRHELESVYDSTSWRVTSPIRRASRIARQNRWRSGA